jgi:hypothetical protein
VIRCHQVTQAGGGGLGSYVPMEPSPSSRTRGIAETEDLRDDLNSCIHRINPSGPADV